jgi:hypothetical protein
MLSHEWRELEVLCERISDLRHRYVAAQRTKNVGLIEGLKDDIAKARRQREFLVQYISARLGSAAADHPSPIPQQEAVGDVSGGIYGFRDD